MPRGAEVVGSPAPSGRHAVSWCLTLVRTGDRTHTHTCEYLGTYGILHKVHTVRTVVSMSVRNLR